MFYTVYNNISGKNTSVFYWMVTIHHQLEMNIMLRCTDLLVCTSGARNSNNAIVSHHILKQMALPITKYQPQLMFASPDQPRFDHDPITGESKGLLIEESRTNLIEYSEDIGGISWSRTASFELNAICAPDGTISADRIYQSDATDYAIPRY